MIEKNHSTVEEINSLVQSKEDTFALPKQIQGTTKNNKLTASLLVLSTLISSSYIGFPTVLEISPLHSDETNVTKNPFQYENKEEFETYIQNKPDVNKLLKRLPALVNEVFGEVGFYVSVFRDYEENWDNLRIVIKSNYTFDEYLELEDKLFSTLEKEHSFGAALQYVTISYG